jgi:hypothetical protein
VAFSFLAFLARDLGLPDADALRWAEEWDAGNSPPKGRERLEQILANVHEYGQNSYGAGLNGSRKTESSATPQPPPTPPAPKRLDGLGVILAYFHECLKPRFKRGSAVFSETLGREIKPAEGCFAPDRELVNRLANATDVPKDSNGEPDPKRIPKFYRDWARSAWQQMLKDLLEEAQVPDVVTTAEEEFRRTVANALHEQVTLGRDDEDKPPRRESLIDWCCAFAKPGRWRSIRSYLIWCRRGGNNAVEVAVRVELFNQVRARELATLGHRKFAALCELYCVGSADRAGGQRAVVLTPEFLAELREGPNLTD